MTDKQSSGTFKNRGAGFALAAFAFAFAFGAAAAPRDLIICAGGVYCYDEQRACEASGQDPHFCELAWRSCVLDACPQ